MISLPNPLVAVSPCFTGLLGFLPPACVVRREFFVCHPPSAGSGAGERVYRLASGVRGTGEEMKRARVGFKSWLTGWPKKHLVLGGSKHERINWDVP